jgi:predicted Zn finger-like uncharacterized protein
MTLSLTCPECRGRLKVADNLAGKKVKCPKCAAVFPAPAPVGAEAPPSQPESVTPNVPPRAEAEEGQIESPRVARDIRQDPAAEVASTLIPYKNARALIAYYLGVFSFIPCAGNVLGPAALVLGILGLRFVKAHPTAKGTGHAIAGIVMGGLTTLVYWGLTTVVVVMGGVAALTAKNPGRPAAAQQPAPAKQGNPQAAVDPGNPAPKDINLGQPLFSADRDLVNLNHKLNIPNEPGRVAALRAGSKINAIAFSRDGETLAVANQADVKLWRLATGQSRTIPVIARSLAFSPDGRHLAVVQAGQASTIEIYDAQTSKLERKVFEGTPEVVPERMMFSPDGGLLIASAKSTFKVWDTATWQERPHDFKDPELAQVLAFTFDRDGKALYVVMKAGVLVVDPVAMKEKYWVKGPPVGTAAIALSPDGNTLVTGAFWGDLDVWDMAMRKHARRLEGARGRAHSLVFSPDGKVLVSAAIPDGTVRLADVTTGKEITSRKAEEGKQLTAFAASPDGKTPVSGSEGGLVKVWDLTLLRGPIK